YSIRRRAVAFFAVTTRVEFAHKSRRAVFRQFELIPVRLRKWLRCDCRPDVQLLRASGGFRAGRRLDTKNVEMWSVDLVFTEQTFQLRAVLHLAVRASEDFFIQREDERVTCACRCDVEEPRHFLLHRCLRRSSNFVRKIVLGQGYLKLSRSGNFYDAWISRRRRYHVSTKEGQDNSLPFGTFRLLRGDQLDAIVCRAAHVALQEKIQAHFFNEFSQRIAARLRLSRKGEKSVEFAFQVGEIFVREGREPLLQLRLLH